MSSFNKVILMGNLTRDPDTRTTPSGATICKIGLAVNRVYTAQDGTRKEEVTFVDCDAFGKQAETISKWMSKGKGILIEGRLRLDQWDDKSTGQARSKLGVVIENFQFVGGRGEGDAPGDAAPAAEGTDAPAPRAYKAPAQQPTAQPPRSAAPRRAPQSSQGIDDDVPF
ncbi:MAG TPA: single-stranded DNA-binding protein [Opitutales bacterium]|nr:single-stranded DNA-binding protein [Opitutales bacterium]